MVTVRPATVADAPTMGRLHVRAWQAAYPGAGELDVINLDPDHWGTGAGRALLEAAQAELARLGFDEWVLWVLSGNTRARRFYEIAGWAADGTESTSEVFGTPVHEVRYRRRSTSADSSSATPEGTE